MNIDFDRLKYSLTGEYDEIMLERKIEELEEKYTQAVEVAQDRFNRIQKAIDYINTNMDTDTTCTILTSGKDTDIGYCIPVFEDLLEILKGDNNE